MLARVGSHLTYSNVMATLAVFLALGGGLAWALARNSVKSKHIADNQVRSLDVQDEGLTGTDISEQTLGEVPHARNAVAAQGAVSAAGAENAELLDNLNSTEFLPSVPNAVGSANVAPNSLTGDDIEESSLNLHGVATTGRFSLTGTGSAAVLTTVPDQARLRFTCPTGASFTAGTLSYENLSPSTTELWVDDGGTTPIVDLLTAAGSANDTHEENTSVAGEHIVIAGSNQGSAVWIDFVSRQFGGAIGNCSGRYFVLTP